MRMFEDKHPHMGWLIETLSEPLPSGFAAVAYLDLVNKLARENQIFAHPFDTAEGRDRLRSYLTCTNPEEFSYGVSAVVSLPFLAFGQEPLLALAHVHEDAHVRLEAAWAAARTGRQKGWEALAEFCLDTNWSRLAVSYMEELGHPELVPDEARDPDFQARAEMCSWLAHPMEFGRFPDEIELYDKRRMFWPPTNDQRDLWLFKYRFSSDNGRGIKEGIGMVGSVTYALFGVSSANMCPEDVYGLHCCWELENKGDHRAPKQRNAATGRTILDHYN
jgi:hypothetical protein